LNRILGLPSFAWLVLAAACGQTSSSSETAPPDAAFDVAAEGAPPGDAAGDGAEVSAMDGAAAPHDSGGDAGPERDATLADVDVGDSSPADGTADAGTETGATDAWVQDVAEQDVAEQEAALPEAEPPEASTDDAGLPSAQACLTGGHVFWVHGDPGCPWFVGTETFGIGSAFAVEAEAYYATYDGALVQVSGVQGDASDWWSVTSIPGRPSNRC
jgi:hypothetical protein